MLVSVAAAFAAERMAPSDIQATFFNGKPFTASTTSGTQFKQHFSIPADYVLPCHKKELRRSPDFERAF
jgi:hypothetical protein